MVYGYARLSTQMQSKNGNSIEVQKKSLQENSSEEIKTIQKILTERKTSTEI